MRSGTFGTALLVAGAALGCGETAPVSSPASAALRPVVCTEYPAERLDTVACRYDSQAQIPEVWRRSSALAATSAVTLGFSHIQWLSAETHVETARVDAPVDCHAGGWGHVECTGGPAEVPVNLLALTRFTFLTPAEAQARAVDPLIPAERRPIDARSSASAPPR